MKFDDSFGKPTILITLKLYAYETIECITGSTVSLFRENILTVFNWNDHFVNFALKYVVKISEVIHFSNNWHELTLSCIYSKQTNRYSIGYITKFSNLRLFFFYICITCFPNKQYKSIVKINNCLFLELDILVFKDSIILSLSLIFLDLKGGVSLAPLYGVNISHRVRYSTH